MTKRKNVICNLTTPVLRGGGWVDEVSKVEVRVMVIAEGYAMVRRKGAMPFVCSVKDLEL